MRHYAIYAQPWPLRIPTHGTFLHTPRESTPLGVPTKRVTDKGLPTPDKKPAAVPALSRPGNKETAHGDRPLKRRKTEPSVTATPVKAQQVNLGNGKSGTGRHSLQSAAAEQVDPPKRKRGRPRLSSPRRQEPKVEVQSDKVLMKRKSIAVQNQPRDSNGRFGKKGISNGRFTRKKFMHRNVMLSRAQRAIERGRLKERKMADADCASISSSRKRSRFDFEERDHPSKNTGDGGEVGTAFAQHLPFGTSWSAQGFKSMGLFRAPNPMSFARRTWVELTEVSESQKARKALDRMNDSLTTSGEETDPPVTPEELFSSATVVDISGPGSDNDETRKRPYTDGDGPTNASGSKFLQIPAYPIGAPTLKPSPFSFARRRWASMSISPDDGSPTRHKTRNSLPERGSIEAVDPQPKLDARAFTSRRFSDFPITQELSSQWTREYDSSSSGEEVQFQSLSLE